MSEATRLRMGILAVGAAATIYFGSTYGAQLKIDKQIDAERKKMLELSIDDQVAMLEEQKVRLQRSRDSLRQKVDAFQARVKERKREREDKSGG